MVTVSAEDVLARFGEMETRFGELMNRHNELLQRMITSEDQHRATHQELERSRARVADLESHGTTKGGGFRLIDPKTMVPEKLANRSQWRGWAEASRSYIENLDARLAKLLKEVEGRSEPITEDEIRTSAVDAGHVAQLNRYLKLRTEPSSHPNTIINAAQSDEIHPLEQWRRLSHEYDPKGLGSEFVEMQELMAPEKLRARSVGGVSAAIEAWEEVERRHKARHGLTLPEKCRITVLFKLIPEKLSEEILRNNTKWESYTKLKDHLHSLQFLRTSGPAPMIQNIEEEDFAAETITTEDGELMRIDKRNGKKVLVKIPPPPKQVAGGERRQGLRERAKNNDCFRCGRPEHRRVDCKWSTHIDGGKPRPPLPPKAANNIEGELEN